MKRWIIMLLCLMLLLTGCKGADPDEEFDIGQMTPVAGTEQQPQPEDSEPEQQESKPVEKEPEQKPQETVSQPEQTAQTPTKPAESETPAQPETPSVATGDPLEYDLSSEVRFFGRAFEASGVYWFNMTLSGFEFKFNGTGAEATLCTESKGTDHTAYIKIYVDGGRETTVAVMEDMQTVTLAKNLKKGEHTVRVVKRTNARSSSLGLYSLTLSKGGKKLSPPAAKSRKMEFIGDSLTVGYGSIAKAETAAWSTMTEDGTCTFAALTAKHFDAEAQVLAVSGRGIVHNVDGDSDKLLPELFEYADLYHSTKKWNFSSYQPDVVVINAGTNDKVTSIADMRTAMGAFLRTVRSKYPNAYIVIAFAPHSPDFTDTYKSLVNGQSRMSFCALPTLTSAQKALGHPNTAGHAVWAETLEKHIENLGIWK